MRTAKSNIIIIAATTIVLLIAATTLIMITSEKEEVKNIELSFRNTSFQKEKISCQVKINNVVFIKSADISAIKDTAITLANGVHKIEVSTTDCRFRTSKNFTVKYDKTTYITTRYCYQPGYKEYLPIYKNLYFSRIVKKNDTEKEKALIRKQIEENITIEELKNKYTPIDRKFEIEIKKQKDIII